MRIFLTGATGYIGSCVLDALVRARHDVTALVRNAERAARVSAQGARPIVGNLAAPETYSAALMGQDGWVHAAFDYARRGVETDRCAIDLMLGAARAARRGFVIYTSGIWVLGNTDGPADETAPIRPARLVAWRPAHEQLVLDAAADGIRTVVVRPGIVYGGARGIVAEMCRDATNGLMRVMGSGDNHWPLVYDRDLGDLYARLVAREDATGIYHANDEGDERVNDLVQAMTHLVRRPVDVRHMSVAEARSRLGDYAEALMLDQIVRSPRARALGWTPALRSVAGNAARLLEEWRAGQEAA